MRSYKLVVLISFLLLPLYVLADVYPSTSGGMVTMENQTNAMFIANTTSIGKSGKAAQHNQGVALLHGGGSTLNSVVTFNKLFSNTNAVCKLEVHFNDKSFDHVSKSVSSHNFVKTDQGNGNMVWQLKFDDGKNYNDTVTLQNLDPTGTYRCSLSSVVGAVGNDNDRMAVNPTVTIVKVGSAADAKLHLLKNYY